MTPAGPGPAGDTRASTRPAGPARPRIARTLPRGTVLGAAALAAAMTAGCGSTPAAGPTPAAVHAVRPPLVTSLTVPGGPSWAIVKMGSSAQHNDFWQLVTRAAGAAKWALATPPGVADNGGLVATPLGGPALLAGVNPSQDLRFSPLASTRDGGTHWTPGLLPAGLATVPSALAAGRGGKVIALTGRGVAELSAPGRAGWTRLTSLASLAATPAGRSCGLTGLTAAAFTAAGAPMLAGQCAHHGIAGIFTDADGRWRLTGPALPAAVAGRQLSVLQLTRSGTGITALLATVGQGGTASLLAAWAASSGHWAVSAPFPLRGSRVLATATGPGPAAAAARAGRPGAAGVVLSAGHAEYLPGPGSAWQRLPALPVHAATLVFGPGRQVNALAASGSVLTSWRLTTRAGHAAGWTRTQTMKVPVPYGSSG